MEATPIIPEPGIYHDVPMSVYQTWQAWNPSLVKEARVSLKQLAYRRTVIREETPSMVLGTAAHCTVLEPDAFPMRYVVWDGGRRQGKQWDAFEEANKDRVILKSDDYGACLRMRNAVRGDFHAGAILSDQTARIESVVVWRDEQTKLLCKGRIDHLGRKISDLKTIAGITERDIENQCATYGYHISMAAYREGVKAVTGYALPCELMFVDSDVPHDVAVVPVDGEAIEEGRRQWHSLLQRIERAILRDEWPGIANGNKLPLILPAWAMTDHDLEAA